ncbi:TonB-dependent receptor domain-containing protein [Methylophaga thalassica]|uniref:TonB-dependent vitamin B12 receptor n=1 Tax=Methylophaga thalassica TaxID=40223 RepID=A0ABQ5TUS4_9GAMM|nr:TonB-dependent receptor [Methylophaga thalassica]WVI84434.1 TonB-dependent receptor [Methylophaga thalassica]GLP99505.1 TonB-dependent vitamin B12 receptor [Methylophaga thalassica]
MNLFSKALPLRACTRLSAFTLISSLLSLPVIASDELDSITVTANRMPTENALAPTTVITEADIEKLQIQDLATLLSRFPGIDMTQNGGLGKTSGVSIRGTNSDHVLVLVDGVKWYSATSGSSALQDFPVSQIERIEIVRGPRAGLYGSEAIGGVIQIFTKSGSLGKPTPNFTVSAGTKNTLRSQAGVSGGNETTKYNLSYSYDTTNGINAREERNPDHDGYRNQSVSLKVNQQWIENWSTDVNLLRSNARNHYDGSSVNKNYVTDTVQQILGLNNNISVNDTWSMSFDLSESRDRSQNYVDDEITTNYNTRHRYAGWINHLRLNAQHQVNIGLEYENDKIDSSDTYVSDSRDNKAVFASWEAEIDKNSWLLSARHDDNESFGHETTGTADYGYQLSEQLKLTANAGTGFKTPTFNDLYYPLDSFGYEGNPDLKPEKSTSYGIGVQGTPSWGRWAVNTYKNKIRNLIVWDTSPSNVDVAKIKGVEFEVTTSLADWQVSADASFLQPEDDKTGNVLPRRAKRLANIHLDRSWGDWSTGASWKLRGHSYDDADNDERLGGYGLLDLRVAYQVDPDWTVRLTGQNMLNKDYQTVEDYYSLGRTVMLSVSYQP